MAIRIGDDGTIINGDEVASSNGAIIREDGTIEAPRPRIGSDTASQRIPISLEAPVSPFENGGSNSNDGQSRQSQPVAQEAGETLLYSQRKERAARNEKDLADLEYELMIAEGHARGSLSKTPVVIGILAMLLGIIVHPIFLVGVAVSTFILYMQYRKKSSFEKEAQRIRSEISRIKQQL